MNFNIAQLRGLTREIVWGLLALIVSFNWIPQGPVEVIGELMIAAALLGWSFYDRASREWPSLFRKLIQAATPVLTYFKLVNDTQAASIATLAFLIVAVWTTTEKSEQ